MRALKICSRFLVVLLSGLLATGAANAEGFSFEMPTEKLRIIIPDIPKMVMQDHPNAALQKHARFMGSDSTGYSISILTPTCDPGMGAEACAGSTFKSLVSRYGLDVKNVTRWKNDSNTYVVLFPVRMDPLVQFKAYFLSGYGGTHCLEIHVSKTVTAKDRDALIAELTQWYKGFKDAKIEPM